jgi:hypothetical protein
METMDDDGEHAEPLTDDELAHLRHARFGELPPRVAPGDTVETTDTDPAHEEPQEPPVRREWG